MILLVKAGDPGYNEGITAGETKPKMPISPFRRSGGAAKPRTVADAAAIFAERKAHAAKVEAERGAKHAAYRNAIATAGPELDTPEVERAGREWNRAIERHDRALEAVRVAESEHAAATAEAARHGVESQWDELERLTAVRVQAAKKFADLAGKLAAARDEFLRAARSARAALPARARVRSHFDVFTEQAAAGQVHAELQRLGLVPDPRRALGVPPAKPMADIGVDLCAMIARARNEPEATQHEPGSADRRAMARPVPNPEDVDREPERAA